MKLYCIHTQHTAKHCAPNYIKTKDEWSVFFLSFFSCWKGVFVYYQHCSKCATFRKTRQSQTNKTYKINAKLLLDPWSGTKCWRHLSGLFPSGGGGVGGGGGWRKWNRGDFEVVPGQPWPQTLHLTGRWGGTCGRRSWNSREKTGISLLCNLAGRHISIFPPVAFIRI